MIAEVGVDRGLLDLGVRADDAVVLGDRPGQLALVALVVIAVGVGDQGVVGLPVLGELGVAGGEEEPQRVLEDVAAEGGLVDRADVVQPVRRQFVAPHPLVVGEVGAERAGELVAARFGQHVDHAALEAAVLGRHARGRGRGLEDGVLDVDRQRLAADVLVDHDAVDQPQVLVRLGARDGDAVDAGVVDAGNHQRRGVDGPVDRQLLLEVERDGGLGDDVLRDGLAGAHDLDLAFEALVDHHHVETLHLLVGDLDAFGGLGPEALEAEGHGVFTGRQEGRDEVAVGLRDDDLVALCGRRADLDGHPRESFSVVGDGAADRTGQRRLGGGGNGRHGHDHCQQRIQNASIHTQFSL